MSEQAISQQEIDAVFPKVAQVIADAGGSDINTAFMRLTGSTAPSGSAT